MSVSAEKVKLNIFYAFLFFVNSKNIYFDIQGDLINLLLFFQNVNTKTIGCGPLNENIFEMTAFLEISLNLAIHELNNFEDFFLFLVLHFKIFMNVLFKSKV